MSDKNSHSGPETGNTSNCKSINYRKFQAQRRYEFMSQTVEEAKKRPCSTLHPLIADRTVS